MITWNCVNCETHNVYEPGRRGQVIALECVKCGAPASIDRKPAPPYDITCSTSTPNPRMDNYIRNAPEYKNWRI